jgi:hypothetical protein
MRYRGSNIVDRLEGFAARVLTTWPGNVGSWSAKHVARRLVRAATGAGANYAEAPLRR